MKWGAEMFCTGLFREYRLKLRYINIKYILRPLITIKILSLFLIFFFYFYKCHDCYVRIGGGSLPRHNMLV